IRLRVLTFGDEELTAELIRARIDAAIARRAAIRSEQTNAVRLVHAEGDELSGLVIDLYDDVVVVEIANAGLDRIRTLIVEALRERLAPRVIYFKNNIPARKLEQLSTDAESIGEGSATAMVVENGLRFRVDPPSGQKTGFFLDQRDNRAMARALAGGRSTLNLFAYSGAFGVYAAAGGARSVENVDISAAAIDLARTNHELNHQIDGAEASFVVADAFQYVRQTDKRFDLIVCDPPA